MKTSMEGRYVALFLDSSLNLENAVLAIKMKHAVHLPDVHRQSVGAKLLTIYCGGVRLGLKLFSGLFERHERYSAHPPETGASQFPVLAWNLAGNECGLR